VSRLFERERELEALGSALASAQAGVGQVVVVEGAAGSGKTALLAAAVRRATGFQTLFGRGGEFERSAGFGVVRDLYGPALAGSPPPELLAGAARLAAPLVGAEVEAIVAPGAATLNHGLYWVTANLAAMGPLVLAVDDAQWADVASLRYLEYLAARIESLACLLMLAWRPGELGSDESFVGRILALGGSTYMSPQPLTRQGSEDLIVSRVPAGVSDELVERCHESSAGNPFLLHELANTIVARTTPGEEACLLAGAAVASVPERVIRIVRTRLSRLAEPAGAIAEALAILGPAAALRHAAVVAGVTTKQAARAADALAAADLIYPHTRIDFVHPLIRRAIYDMQPALIRSEAHGRAARLLAAEEADGEVVAGHLLLAPAESDAAVVAELMKAARTAMNRGAPDAAIAYLLRALDEPPNTADRVQVLRALGNAEARAGRREGLARLRDARARSHDPRERLDIALEIAHHAMGFGPAGPSIVSTELSAALAESSCGDPQTVMLAHTLVLGVSVTTASAQVNTNVERARAMYRSATDGIGRRALAGGLAFLAVWLNDPIDDVRSLARHALEDDDAYEQLLAAGWQLAWCCQALAIADEWDLAERRLAQALESAQHRGSTRPASTVLWNRMAVRALRGDLLGAETDGRQALELWREPNQWLVMFIMFGVSLIDVLIDRASPMAAQALLEELGLDGRDVDPCTLTPQVLCSRSRLRLAQGRPNDALVDIEAARRHLRRAGLTPAAIFSVEELAARVLATLGRHQQAQTSADEALRLAKIHGAPAAIGTALRVGALLQRGPEQVRQLTAAVELMASSGREVEHARTLIELGAAMRRQAQRSAARLPLSQGRELAHRCGALALEQRATEELRATGARPRRIMLSGADSLTTSERRVAEMAADGLTSRMIAEQLFVTQKTIETHLGHIYRKLDIPGRQHIADALKRAESPRDRRAAGS
jgi:DNA-binding CsgD family transcriptional regulator